MRRWLASIWLAGCGLAHAAPEAVTVPSLDQPGAAVVALPGFWFRAPVQGPAPVVLALHGCGGLFDARGRLADRYADYAARLNAMGIHLLATDSLTPRGEKELCTQRTGQRKVTQTQRRRDVLGAVAWLAARADVDASKIGVLGWSNGGSAVLAASNRRHAEVAAAGPRPSLWVAYYPGCEAELARGYEIAEPLLMLLGEADDWTPAAPCKALAATSGPKVQWEAFAGAYHGFDGTAPVRLRRDVPNGVNPGQGVHVGGDPQARTAAAARLEKFLRESWSLGR